MDVWSNSKQAWLTDGVVLEAPDKDSTIDGYAVPAGALKVVSSAGEKWIMPDQVSKSVRRKLATASASSTARPTMTTTGALCKWGCGRAVQPGLTRGMKPFDTCCKGCAMSEGKGSHDANCGGATPLRRHSTGSLGFEPKHWLTQLLKSEERLAEVADPVFTKKAAGKDVLSGPMLKEALGCIVLADLKERIDVSDTELTSLVSNAAARGDVNLATFRQMAKQLLEARYKSWFPTKLPTKTHSFVRKNTAPVRSVYDFGTLLGEGSFGKVYSVTHKVFGEKRVCKQIAKLKGKVGMKIEEILHEIDSMAMLDHPNVIKVYEYFEDEESVSQIMEPCNGGELQEQIDGVFQKGKPFYGEAFICDVMKQTLRALAFMHSQPIMHKDLKPQNIMLVEKTSSSIKVIDFGLAELFEKDQKVSKEFGGTLLYMAPEVFRVQLNMKSDIWSAGVILYNMITGDYPFMATWPLPPGKDMEWWQSELARTISEDKFRQHARLSDKSVSPSCIDLLTRMLDKDVDRRPDASACLDHAWFKSFEALPPPLSVGVTQCLAAFAKQPELKKAVLLLIAHQCTAPALNELRAIFTHFDTDNRGTLSTGNFREVLQRTGIPVLQVETIIWALDKDNSGTVEWTEFMAAALCVIVSRRKELIHAAFSIFDRNGDGKVSQDDFLDFFGVGEVAPVWKRHLPEELQLLGTQGPGGLYTKEQFEAYMDIEKRMQIVSGAHLAAVA